MPILYVSPPSASPVAIYISKLFDGLIAILEIPITDKKSLIGCQFMPPSIVFQRPPAGVPA